MWFDVVENITKSKTFIVVLDDGRNITAENLQKFISDLQIYNINNSKIVSLKTSVGAKIAQSYGLHHQSGVLLLRANKELVWSWHGRGLPLINEVVYRYHQIG